MHKNKLILKIKINSLVKIPYHVQKNCIPLKLKNVFKNDEIIFPSCFDIVPKKNPYFQSKNITSNQVLKLSTQNYNV